ncbi:MAG: carboxyl transferase domain-containing protein [Myxococcales bacterium]
MQDAMVGLGRVGVVEGDGAARVSRLIRELARAGRATAPVPLRLRWDEPGSIGEALRQAKIDSAWLGPAPLHRRAAFAEACAKAGVRQAGPDADVLARVAAPAALASQLGMAWNADPDPRARLLEVVVARDSAGGVRAIGIGDASLRRRGLSVLVESPPARLSGAEQDEAKALATRVCEAAGWTGICAVQLSKLDGRWSLSGIDPFAQSGAAIEAVASADLARLSLLLAAGAATSELSTAEHGHAFAARIVARDPESGSGTRAGRVEVLSFPSGPGVRADAALREGDEPEGPDSVLVTLVSHGADRGEALQRLQQALVDGDLVLRGGGTSKAWLIALAARPEIAAGDLASVDPVSIPAVQPRREAALIVAAIEAYHAEEDLERARFVAEARRGRPRVGPSSGRSVELRILGDRYQMQVRQLGPNEYRIDAGSEAPVAVRLENLGRSERRLDWQGQRHRVFSTTDGLRHLVQVDDVAHVIAREPGGIVASPMPAVVAAIHVELGQKVAADDPLVRIESMKVQAEVTAPFAGTVREILAAVNGQVDAGAPLLRIESLAGEKRTSSPQAPVLSLGGSPEAPSVDPRARYRAALGQLRQLLLGFDITSAEAGRLAESFRELVGAAPRDDAEALAAEDSALCAFADIQSLFSRVPPLEEGAGPILEDLWRYLHEPEARGAGLSKGFVSLLRCALHQYGVSMDAPGRELELSLLRIQKARERVAEQQGIVASILERWLGSGESLPAGAGTSRRVLDRLVELGEERFPALADLAREVRYRSFDKPALDRQRTETWEQAERDLSRLAASSGEQRDIILARLVACTQPLSATLITRIGQTQSASLRARLVETVLRRYYRFRALERITASDVDGLPCAWVEYALRGKRYRLFACSAPSSAAADAAARMARLVSDVPSGRDVLVELYLGQEGAPSSADETSERLRSVLEATAFARPPLRVSVVVGGVGREGRSQVQQHFTFRFGPSGRWAEERRYRDAHPMLFERLQLGRLARFDLTRLPTAEDIYLYRAVAQGNPKDERLFAMAEVRDLTPVSDATGATVQLPELERILHEALAGMRVFQARRAPHERLEWNRVHLTLTPPLELSRGEIQRLAARLTPATAGLGLEMVSLTARIRVGGELREKLLRVAVVGEGLSIRWDDPTEEPLQPMSQYQQKVVQLRRRGLVHPFELVRMLAPPAGSDVAVPPGEFVEYDLDDSGALVPVSRPAANNTANIVVGVVRNYTARYPEGMERVVLLSDPGKEMGSVAEPECKRIYAALDLAEKMRAPLEWFEVCAGAKISMTSGTENMDWVSRVLRRIIEFTQAGGEINVLVLAITVGAQPYWNAEATMLMHTKGILAMVPGSCMVLTGKQALEYSGAVSAEDNEGIGGYDRIMGPNGQAQYRAGSVAEAIQILLRHYDHCYVAPGERFPRKAVTSDPRDRDVRSHPHGPEGGAGFETVGDVFSAEHNADRKKPFEIRKVMEAAIDRDFPPLERWRDLRGGETGVVWDAHLGGNPVCLIGIQSRPMPRLEFVPADGPEVWSAGTLFPQSSKKIARAVNSASGNRPLVILANLSGFDGSPESMRRLQLEYGAEIGRSIVNFQGPIVFCVVSRYHGGAFVVFARTLTENIEIAAIEGARASVIGGAPAAAVVFAREVEIRTRKDPRVVAAEKAGAGRGMSDIVAQVRSEKLGEVGEEYDRVHSVERALKVGSLDRIIAARELRPYLVEAVERGMARFDPRRT